MINVTTLTPAPPIQIPQGFKAAQPGAALVPVATLQASHDYYKLFCQTWEDIDVLYQGGKVLQMQADRFLLKKPHEMPDVYACRKQRFTYHNLIGTAIGYYLSKLFEENPEIDIKQDGETIREPETTEEKKPAGEQAELWDFYVEGFLKDCDGSKTTYIDFQREAIRQALLFKRCYVLIDLPKGVQNAATRGEQNIRPLLRLYDPRQAVNWETDAVGNLKWILFQTVSKERAFLQEDITVKRWFYFDRKQFMVYEWRSDDPARGQTDGTDTAKLVDQGPHSMADYLDEETGEVGRVPVETFEVPDGMWLAHRVFLPLLDHLNTDNTLGWALFNSNLAVPVITGPTDYQPTLTEVGYIYIREGTFAWAEPSGVSFDHSQKRIDNLREEIFRLMYLQAQGRSSAATPAAQSGFSKELDMVPAGDVLKFLGDTIRAKMQCILELVSEVRQDEELTFDVRGFDFDDEDVLPEIEAATSAIAVGVRSETFHREVEKQLVMRYGKDWDPELLAKCCQEVDEAPTKEELADQQSEKETKQMKDSMKGAAIRLVVDNGKGGPGAKKPGGADPQNKKKV